MQLPKIEKHEEKTKKIISSKSSSNMQKKSKIKCFKKKKYIYLSNYFIARNFCITFKHTIR